MTAHTPARNDSFHEQPWAVDALCAETDLEAFFPDKGGSTREAKAVCNGNPDTGRQPCPVRAECLDWALLTEQRFGIFGGTSERERRKLAKEPPTEPLAATGTDVDIVAAAPILHTVDEPQPARHYGLPYVGGANGGEQFPLPDPDKPVKIEQGRTNKSSVDWAELRRRHEERRRAEGTLDTPAADATGAPELVRCRWCRTPQPGPLVDDLCTTCRDDAERAFHAPDVTVPSHELTEPETQDPTPQPPEHLEVVTVTTPAFPPYVVDMAKVLRDTERSTDPNVRAARKDVANAFVRLSKALGHTWRPGGPATPPAAPQQKKARVQKLDDTQRAEIVRRYKAGESTTGLARTYGVSGPTIVGVLDRAGVPRRSKAEAARIRIDRERGDES